MSTRIPSDFKQDLLLFKLDDLASLGYSETNFFEGRNSE